MIKRNVLLIILVVAFHYAHSGCVQCKPYFPIGQYLVHSAAIVYAKVKNVSQNKFTIEVMDFIKPGGKKRSVVVSPGTALKENFECVLNDLIKMETEYIFILSRLNRFPKTYLMTEPCNRFIVQRDSLFIGYEFISGLKGIESLYINERNSYEDELLPLGYKISVDDFRKMVKEVNKSFIPSYEPSGYHINSYIGKQKSKKKVYGYFYKEPVTKDQLTLAIIRDLKEKWKL